jgi:hypothetical protein
MPALSNIVAYIRTEEQADQLRAHARQLAGAFERLYAQVGSHVAEMALLCAADGKANLLAQLPTDVAASIEESLALIRQVWPMLSEQPFPEMPDAPVPAPTPEGGN